jgi:heme/copper-type cytochrome/quinol oxidase subunit 4
MNAFWIFGIVLNVTLTALAIWWVVKQMRRRNDKNGKR